MTQPVPSSVKQIQQAFDENAVLLEYSLGEKRSFLWAVTASSLSSFVLPGRAAIETKARRLYELLTARNQGAPHEDPHQAIARVAKAGVQYPGAAREVSDILLSPTADLLSGKRLVIVADGILQYLPFSVLATGHEIVYLPSALTLIELRRETYGRSPARKTIAVIADPVFGEDDDRLQHVTAQVRPIVRGNGQPLGRLPFTRQEADAILSLTRSGDSFRAIGFDANLGTVESPELAKYRIIHLATHGLLDAEHPELSALAFSLVDARGRPQDGQLKLHDVYNPVLPADLVVLSACETALGKQVSGEGLVGLTRGFIYAGAKRGRSHRNPP